MRTVLAVAMILAGCNGPAEPPPDDARMAVCRQALREHYRTGIQDPYGRLAASLPECSGVPLPTLERLAGEVREDLLEELRPTLKV